MGVVTVLMRPQVSVTNQPDNRIEITSRLLYIFRNSLKFSKGALPIRVINSADLGQVTFHTGVNWNVDLLSE